MTHLDLRGLLLLCFGVVLVGCGQTASVGKTVVASHRVQGVVHGGQNPVSGATIQLYTVGTTGDGSNALALIATTVKSDVDGSFDITDLYSCTNATEVYLTATQGSPATDETNPNLALMVALGPCTAVPSMSYIEVNELTTVAAVNALAPYMASYKEVGSGTGDLGAMQAAFTLADEFVDPSTGASPGVNVPSGYIVPTDEIDTLGNVAATCVNSGGGTAGQDNACGTFFSLTTPSGKTAPTNTIGALLYLAKNPDLNTQDLYETPLKDAPFQPILQSMPANFSLGLTRSPLTLNPVGLTYATTPLGATTEAQSAALANTGTTAVAITDIGVGGADAGDFAATNNCPAMLAGHAACTIETTFTPTEATARNATLRVNSGLLYTGLSGVGIASSVGPASLSPTSLTFWEPNLAQVVTLTNYGTMPLAIAAIQPSSGFAESDNCGNSLSGESVCTIYVIAQGALAQTTGTLTVVDSDTTDVQTVSLTGNVYYSGYDGPEPFGEAAVGQTGLFQIFQGGVYQTTLDGMPIYQYVTSLSGPAPLDYSAGFYVGPTCSSNGFSTCNVEYEFVPTAVGVRYAVMSDNEGNTFLFKGIGATQTESFSLSPEVLSFPQTAVGSSSLLNLTITNTSVVALTFNDPYGALTGGATNNGDFTFEGGSQSIAAGGIANYGSNGMPTGTVYVKFTPTVPGLRTSTLTITEASGVSHSVLVIGNSTYAAPVLSPASSFGNESTGSTGPAQTITATIPGEHAAGAQVSGPFVLTGTTTCATGASTCKFLLQFAPTTLGPAMGSLVVTDFETGTSATEALSGTGVAPAATMSVNPTSLTFIPRSEGTTSIAQTITLTNMGTVELVIATVSLSGTNPGDYAETDNCSGALIDPGGTCTISVTNTPTFVGGSLADVKIVSNATGSPTLVSLSGTGQ